MKDDAYLDVDHDPSTFLSYLLERLSTIPGSTWKAEPSPWHTTYDDWHVLGSVSLPAGTLKEGKQIAGSSISGAADTEETVHKHGDQIYRVAARVSKHSLRLERQFQLNKSILDEYDPLGERHVRALQLIKLPPRTPSETALTVILMEHAEANMLRDIVNFGPGWYTCDGPPAVQKWNPSLTSSGLNSCPNISLNEFLEFAIGACECCEMIHQGNRFVHGELRIDALCYFRESRSVQLLNYGSGVRAFENGLTSAVWSSLSREFGIEHKLQFIAPEQTGRMQAAPDSRTDIYSLGIIFYNMLTGKVPFPGSTPLEVMQNILSRRVPVVSIQRPDIPEALCAVLQKMTLKNIDDRYHSASGIKWDLRRIQTFLNEGDSAALVDFKAASHDFNSTFVIPNNLVGRERERQSILQVIERIVATQPKVAAELSQDHGVSSHASSVSGDVREQTDLVDDIAYGSSERCSFNLKLRPARIARASSNGFSHDVFGGLPDIAEPATDEGAIDEGAIDDASSLHRLDGNSPSTDSADSEAPKRAFSVSSTADGNSFTLRNVHKFRRKGNTEIIALSGAQGLGKSSLIQSIQQNARSYGYFCTGKYEQTKRTPFESTLKVMSSLFRQIFSELDLDTPFHKSLRAFVRPIWSVLHVMLGLPEWLCDVQASRSNALEPAISNQSRRASFSASLAPSGRSTADSLRVLPSTPKISRFTSIFSSTLRFLSSQKLLVFSLDDIQYADEESLELLLSLIQAKIPMALILTFRDKEELPVKAAALLQDEHAVLTSIDLSPLTEDQITTFVCDCLNRSPEYLFPLVAVISEKTGGNPFFIKEMLETCHRKGCISFSWKESQWTYNLDMVFKAFESSSYGSQMTNDFILSRLQEFPESCRQLLAWASLIGSTFSFALVKSLMLGTSDGSPQDGLRSQVTEAPHPKAGLVRQTSQDIVRALSTLTSSLIIQPGEDDDHFRFCHDRYQQASTSLPECTRLLEMHYSIAVMLMRQIDEVRDIFDITPHVCAAVDLIKARIDVRSAYRSVLHIAAEKAASTGGKTSSLKYYTSAVALLQRNPWNESKDDVDYRETLDLFVKTSECYWYEGFIEPALALLQTVFRKARTPVDKVAAYVVQSRIYIKRGDTAAAFRGLKRCLADLDFDSPTVTWAECDEKFQNLREQLVQIDPSELLQRPVTEDPVLIGATRCLSELMAAAFFCDPLMFYQFALMEVGISLGRGVTAEIGLAFIHLGTIAIGRFDLVAFGCELGSLAKSFLALPYVNSYVAGRGLTLHSILLGYFDNQIGDELPVLERAFENSFNADDDYMALMIVGNTSAAKVWSSQDLTEVESYCSWGPEEIRNWQDNVSGGVIITVVRQFCRALQGKTELDHAASLLSDNRHNSEAYLSYICERSSNPERSRAIYMSFHLTALCLFGYHAEALQIGEETTKNIDAFWSLRFSVSNAFYLSISVLALLREDFTGDDRDAVLRLVRERHERMIKWAEVNDVNFAVWSHVLSAQLDEANGRYEKVLSEYEEALDHAEIHNFIFEQAVTLELYAEFMIRRKANRPARALLHEAIAKYQAISAFGKARHVATKHEWLLQGTTSLNKTDASCQTADNLNNMSSARTSAPDISSPEFASRMPASPVRVVPPKVGTYNGNTPLEELGLDMIDVTSILQSSQVLSSELNVDRLLAKMTKIILESTGAELALVVVEDEERGWVVSAVRDASGHEFRSDIRLEEAQDREGAVAKQVIMNCIRFREPLLIANVLEDDRFSNVHPDYQHIKVGRAACAMPLSHSDHVFGVVYMEGLPHSFTERNTTLLQMLVNPVSISITNAKLFKRVEKVSASNAVMVNSQKHALAQAREAQQKAKMAEEEAVRNLNLKEEAVRAKSMFLANVSHELRTPLNGVIGMSELLKSSVLTSEQEGYADSIRVCADTLLTVINDILDFSKLEAGKMQMFSVPLNLTETIGEVVRALSYNNTLKPLQTIMDLNVDKEMLVMGDPVRLHQILMNLLSNSYKFTPQGTVTVRAVVENETDRDVTITCSVEDTGVGITEEQKKKLFKPFSQADSSTARTYGGTGLGLSICKAIIENVMNGTIWMDSELGKGTTVSFTLTFPKVARNTSRPQEPSRSTSRTDPMAVFSPESEGNPYETSTQGVDIAALPRDQIRICIAEDNPINQKIAISFVRKLRFTCEAFGDGRQAVNALVDASKAGNPFHIVLMDVQMPVLDGYDATREARRSSDPNVRDVIIIAMTASAIRGDREKCLEAGMNNYLAKPVRQQMLKQMLDGYTLHGPRPEGDDQQTPPPT